VSLGTVKDVKPDAPGWYDDPSGSPHQRWFDGEEWGALKNPFEKPLPAAKRPRALVGSLVFTLVAATALIGWFSFGPTSTPATPSTTPHPTTTTLYLPPLPTTTVPLFDRPVSSTTLPDHMVEYRCANGATITMSSQITLNSCAGIPAP
jgi:hypothetical protein